MAWWGLGVDLGTTFGTAVAAHDGGQLDVLEVAATGRTPSTVLGPDGKPAADPLAARLALLVAEGRRRFDGDPGQLVLTHPAAWGENELAVLRQAAEQVVPAVPVRLVPESVAAAEEAKYGALIHGGGDPQLTAAYGAARLTLLDQAAAPMDDATAQMFAQEAQAAEQYEHPGYPPSGFPGYAPPPDTLPPTYPVPAQPGYPGYPGPGYDQAGYGPAGYDQAGYDQTAYGTAGYGQPGYEQGYPQPGYPGYGQAPAGPAQAGYGDPYGTAIPVPRPQDPERERRKRVLIAVAAAVAVAVIAAGGILVAQGKIFGGSGQNTAGGTSTDNSGSTGSNGSTSSGGGSSDDNSTDDNSTDGGSTDVDPSNSSNVSSQASVTADETAADRVDAAGNPTSYRASNTTDGDLATAWREDGSGAGDRLVYQFDSPTTITSVGMTNGYTKVDSVSGADRYRQERRITQVTWSFSDGTSKTQDLTDGDTSLQSMDVTPVQTSSITLTIDTVTDPGDADFDYTAISEVEIDGQ